MAQFYVLGILVPEITKAWCGFNNILTATLLCPVDHFATIKADPDESVGAYLLGEIAEHSSSRTRMQLVERKLPMIDSGGDPKLPIFLYDLDLVDSSMTQGLFRGPLLLAVSMFPHGVECHQPQLFRFTIIFSFHLLL